METDTETDTETDMETDMNTKSYYHMIIFLHPNLIFGYKKLNIPTKESNL